MTDMDTQVIEVFADERRRAIIELLADGERCVCDVSELLGISNALASHHLKKLREAGVVVTRRRGAWLHCRLDERVLLELADSLRDLALRSGAAPAGCCGADAGRKSETDE